MKLVWSNTARNDLKQLNTYIGQDSPIYARQFIQRILRVRRRFPVSRTWVGTYPKPIETIFGKSFFRAIASFIKPPPTMY